MVDTIRRFHIVTDEPGKRLVLESEEASTSLAAAVPLLGPLLARLTRVSPLAVSENELRVLRLAATPEALELEIIAAGARLTRRVRIDADAWRTLRVRVGSEGQGERDLHVAVLTSHLGGFADMRFAIRVADLDQPGEVEDFAFRLGRAAGLMRYRIHESDAVWDVELHPEPNQGYRSRGADLLVLPEAVAPADYRPTPPEQTPSVEPKRRFRPKRMRELSARARSFVIEKWRVAERIELLRKGATKRRGWGLSLLEAVAVLGAAISIATCAGLAYVFVLLGLAMLGIEFARTLVHGAVVLMGGIVAVAMFVKYGKPRAPLQRRIVIEPSEERIRIEQADDEPRELHFIDATAVTLDVGPSSARIGLLLPRGEELLFERVVDKGEMPHLVPAARSMAETLAALMKLPLQG